ncbi:Flp pilus assembly protein CpaB [Marinobacter lipolyticus]|uniref:Flp pilus assembly protein CpaB n=1 Tax=Marinobacter lipolyticus TaxID=209639 RepID=UPI001BCFEE3B|nr:Flp pilus assembly protein CpaB [Marinobacter lipolyticus]MBS8242176.1 Flp pilus assembly protein CpaB [Marinobacter lipolyticus]
MNKRLIYALPATVLALVALGLAVAGLLASGNKAPPAQPASVAEPVAEPRAPEYRYLVATGPLSPGVVMNEESFVAVTSSQPVVGAIPADEAPFGQIIRSRLGAGQMLTEVNLRNNSVLDSLVPEGHQAMAMAVDEVSGVGGLLRPGDRVDVTASFRRSDKDAPAALKLLRNVLVLAVRGVPYQGEADDENDARRNNTVVLSVPEAAVSRLLLASSEGSLRLAAVAPAPASPASEPATETPSSVTAVYLEDLFPAKPEPAPVRRASPPPATRVQLFEGTESRSVYVR